MKLYNDYRLIATNCTVEFNGDYGYEVKDGDTDTHTVNLELKKCTCRLWDLGGIPCHHAIKALLHKKNGTIGRGSLLVQKRGLFVNIQAQVATS